MQSLRVNWCTRHVNVRPGSIIGRPATILIALNYSKRNANTRPTINHQILSKTYFLLSLSLYWFIIIIIIILIIPATPPFFNTAPQTCDTNWRNGRCECSDDATKIKATSKSIHRAKAALDRYDTIRYDTFSHTNSNFNPRKKWTDPDLRSTKTNSSFRYDDTPKIGQY